MLCQECQNRETCTELCPSAQKYVNEGVVNNMRESLFPNGDVSRLYQDKPNKIWRYLDGKKQEENGKIE